MSDLAPGLGEEMIAAFMRIARGDFAVRVTRTYARDTGDLLAYFVNLIAQELGRLVAARDRDHAALVAGVERLSEAFLALAAGDFSARAPRSEAGDPLDVLAFLFNNTAAEIGDAVREVDRQRAVVEAILDSMLDGVVLVDAAGTIQRTNAAFARVLGRAAEELHGAPLDARDRAFAIDLVDRVAAAPVRDRDLRFLDVRGELVPLSVNASPQRGADGAPAGAAIVARDERELRQAQARLQLTDRLATVGTLAASVAHEINNPLAFVIANLQFVAEELDELIPAGADGARADEVRRAVAATLGGAQRVRQIVRDLKAFSRVDDDGPARVDLPALLDSSLAMVRNEIRHHARVVRAYGETPPVVASEGRLLQVFINLLHNAAQAIPAGRAGDNEIRVSTGTAPDGSAVVEVRDTGRGIAPADLPRIFDPFFTTKPRGEGTGLGLSITREIVTSLRGRLEVDSELGVGTTFRLILPPGTATAAAATTPAATAPASRRLRILAIDDEEQIGASLERILGRDHEVTFVADARRGVELATAREFDVVLCDVMMPDVTGLEVLAQLAAARPALAARLVFMTGGAFSPGSRALLERTANARIDKPFDAAELRALLLRVAAA